MKYATLALFALSYSSLNGGIIRATFDELAEWSELNAVLQEEIIYKPCRALYLAWTHHQSREETIGSDYPAPEKRHHTQRRGFSALAGTIPADVREITDFIRQHERYARVGARMPRGILLWGPPGTGKTSIARAIAEECDAAFIPSTGSEFVHIYVGAGPAAVRDLFARARAAADTKASRQAIIFIDEIDAIGSKREHEISSEYRNTLNELLNQMDGFSQDSRIFVIAATNNPHHLDAALLRRFERHVHIKLPDESSRKAIIAHYAQEIAYTGDQDFFDELAAKTAGWSGDELRTLVNEAAVIAARNNSMSVEVSDFKQALKNLMALKIR